MKNDIKILIIIGLILGGLSYFFDLSSGTKASLFVGGVLLYFAYLVDKRLKRIENAINFPEKTGKEELTKPISYRLNVSISIDWIEIIKRCFPSLKDDEQTGDFVKKLEADTDLQINIDRSLFRKNEFGFVRFYDGISELTQIWSDHYKTFIPDLKVIGWVFDAPFLKIENKFPDNKISRGFHITPSYIGFRGNLSDGDLSDEDKISQIPFYDIINFFQNVYKKTELDTSDYGVKIFPDSLQIKFEKHSVKYENVSIRDFEEEIKLKWFDKNEVVIEKQSKSMHKFITPHYNIYIDIEFFGR